MNNETERMWAKFYPSPLPPEQNDNLPDAIICDLDGTLCNTSHRSPYDTSRYLWDSVRYIVLHAIQGIQCRLGAEIHFVSGRSEEFKDITKAWLNDNFCEDYQLHMRARGDTRRDSIVKTEIHDRVFLGKYNIVAIFDDRPQVIRECWRALGYADRIFDVGPGKEF